MLRRLSIAALAFALLATACGGTATLRPHGISVDVTTRTYNLQARAWHARSFSLSCDPPAGTLPLAARICRDIAKQPVAMLDPPRARWLCGGTMFGPRLTVRTYRDGRTAVLSGEPGCGWPGGTALAVYFAATRRDTRTLAILEPRLRCDADPTLLARPTPRASALACVRGLWTPRSERLIRIAEQVPPLPGLNPAKLFPRDIGAQRCTIRSDGPGLRKVSGTCGVSITHVWSSPVVTFVEDWPFAPRRTHRHTWQVTISHGRPTLTASFGLDAPQFIS